MSISKGIGGDNTLTISSRTVTGAYRPIIEVIEYGTGDYRVNHYTGHSIHDALGKANALLADEAKTAQIEHEYFDYVNTYKAIFPQQEMWEKRYESEVQKVKLLRTEIMKLNGRQLYEVNYTVSNSFTVYVEATSPEDAQHVVEEIYQNNYDALPEDGELDHEIELGTLEHDMRFVDFDEVLSIEDAS